MATGFVRAFSIVAIAACTLTVLGTFAEAQVTVVATTPTYASLVEEIGGPHARVQSLMKGPENVHRLVPTPSKMMALRNADLLVHSGLDCEPWLPVLLRGSRNREVQPGQPGNVNCARGIKLKKVPRGRMSRAEGDLHIFGNPHYQSDPINVILMARTIRDALKQSDPANADDYDQRYTEFEERMKKKLVEWLTKLRPYQGEKVVAYHDAFCYFTDRFGLETVGFVEPKPGIEPSPSHTAELVTRMRQTGCKVILVNSWADRATAQSVAQRTGATAIVYPEWVGGVAEADDVFACFDYMVDSLVEALSGTETE